MSLVLKSLEEGILTLTIHRPEALNALNRSVIDALSAALEAAQDNDDERVIVLTGAGEKAFVAGADIKEFADFDQAQGEDLARRGQREREDHGAEHVALGTNQGLVKLSGVPIPHLPIQAVE